MKRTPLQRKTPLRRVAMEPRRTPLRSSMSRLGLHRPWRHRVTPEERGARLFGGGALRRHLRDGVSCPGWFNGGGIGGWVIERGPNWTPAEGEVS